MGKKKVVHGLGCLMSVIAGSIAGSMVSDHGFAPLIAVVLGQVGMALMMVATIDQI